MIEKVATKAQLAHLQAAINEAAQQAAKLADTEDGGTCNFDTCVLKCSVPKAMREQLQLTKCSWGYYKGWYFVNAIPANGQGNRRTRQAEIAAECLRYAGYNAAVYMAID